MDRDAHTKGSRIRRWRHATGRERRRLAYVAPTRIRPRRSPLVSAKPLLPAEPITRAEMMHLARTIKMRRQPVTIIFVAVFAASLALTGALGLLARSGSLTTVNMRETYTGFANILNVINIALVVLIFVTQLVLNAQALQLSADTIAREKQGRTWDLLVLTGQSARRIVYGKWWAVLRHLFATFRTLIFLRAGAILWLGLTAVPGGLFTTVPDAAGILIAPLLILGYTLLDIMLPAAVGLMASTQVARSFAGTAALVLCMAVYGVLCLAFPILMNVVMIYHLSSMPVGLYIMSVDGGGLLALNLLGRVTPRSWNEVLVGGGLNLVLLGAAIWLLLEAARRLARRQGASAL